MLTLFLPIHVLNNY